ncbi:uncharacterized protein LOC129759841 [Uranotaenia lowii]|uniref:uncharacterized protein LOC129759841 n=1 Tax=Uranotaenia lowii TaxID=190385 RepID=UPI00247AFE7A|nr:uncharacterized protein LOC129759841 [Uranotaenia lowii]
MSSALSSVLGVLLAASLVIKPGHSLVCELCVSEYGWEDCQVQAASWECSHETVMELHEIFAEANPNLITASDGQSGFKCFQLQLFQGNVSAYMKGCTFKEADICNGWLFGVKECKTCNSDLCNVGSKTMSASALALIVSVLLLSLFK